MVTAEHAFLSRFEAAATDRSLLCFAPSALEAALERLPSAEDGPRLVILLPAHNESANIELALDSLENQSRRPDLIAVITDNCTDDTEALVLARGGAVVAPSIGNLDKKAGALNQAMQVVLPRLQAMDAVMVMDADSALDPRFIEGALRQLGQPLGSRSGTKVIGGVGGTFRGGRGGGFVGMLQRNEYARYARDVRRLKGRVLVLTGTATIFSVSALRAVIDARGSGRLPRRQPQVYDTTVLTEDNELTLALLHLGYAILSPSQCLLETEVMTTWGDLWRQRVRWKRGALENLADYGLTRITARYWGRQLLTHLGVLVTAAYLGTIVWSLSVHGRIDLHPIWLALTAIFCLERVVTVRERGTAQMVLASLLLVEMAFDIYLQAAQGKAFLDTITRTERKW
jgi:cellulose synthase/poly-beta-1,6-N-acetylglucosamine synthase-like glycosyltransferase